MFDNLLKSLFGSKHDRELKRVEPIVDEINRHVDSYRDLSDDQIRAKTTEFRGRLEEALKDFTDPEERRLAERDALDELLPEAFAVVKETCRRLCGRAW